MNFRRIMASEVTNTRDNKQITFELDKRSVLYWRRALLLRYFVQLGNETDFSIEWIDSDKAHNTLNLNDEEKPFTEKLPNSDLFKSVVKVVYKSAKLLTITIYYTTKKCLVQGNRCQHWVIQEFEKIKCIIDQCLKGGNPASLVDQEVKKLTLSFPGSDHTLPKTIDDSLNETEPKIIDENSRDSKKKTEENKGKNFTPQSAQNSDCSCSVSDIARALHSFELKMVECNAQFCRKLENVEKEIKNLNIKIDKCNQNTSEQQKGDQKSLTLERICSKIDKLTENVKSITEKQNELVMKNCEQMQKLTELENVTKEVHVKTVTETRKEDQTLHVHVQQTSDDKDEIDLNEDFPIIRENTNSVPNSEQRNHQERQNRSENDSEFDVWIVGTSVVKDLNPKLMYKNRKVRRTILWDKTVAGAIDFVKTGKIKSKTILFQIGSNDLDHMSEDEVMKEIEQMVKVTREMYPESNVVFT